MKLIKKHLKYIWDDFRDFWIFCDDEQGESIGDMMIIIVWLFYNLIRTITYIPVIPFILIYSLFKK